MHNRDCPAESFADGFWFGFALRLLSDFDQHPVGRTTFLLWKFYGGSEPLLPSGLLGPVRLESGG